MTKTKSIRTKKKLTRYPRLWQNKTLGQKVRVMPWWEIVNGGEMVQVDELGEMITEVAGGRLCKFGVITQVGYLLENEHGVWLGVGPKATKHFKDLGEWKKK